MAQSGWIKYWRHVVPAGRRYLSHSAGHDGLDVLHQKFESRVISRSGDVNWPPRSRDIKPLNYFLWGYLKSQIYANKPETIDSLKVNITNSIQEIQPICALKWLKIGGTIFVLFSVATVVIWSILYSILNATVYYSFECKIHFLKISHLTGYIHIQSLSFLLKNPY